MTSARAFDALAQLNRIGSGLNRLDTGDLAGIQAMLRAIVQATAEVVPGAQAVIYPYDPASGQFDAAGGIAADTAPVVADGPRPGGLGFRAVARGRRVLSYHEPDHALHPLREAQGVYAAACFPLTAGGLVLGVLYVYLYEDRRFTELELLLLENFVNFTAMTLSLARQHYRRERELRRLRRAGMVISSRSNLQGTLDAILQVALEITDAVYGIFRLVDRSGTALVYQAFSGDDLSQPAVETLPIDEHSVMGLVALRREPIVISDLRQEQWGGVYYPLDRQTEMRAEVAVPLIGAGGRLEGVLNLESPQVGAFDRQDRYILQILATQAVAAIQEARLLDALQGILLLLPRQPVQEIHNTLVERACDLLNAPGGRLWILDPEGGELLLQACYGIDAPPQLPQAGTLAGLALARGEAVTLDAADRTDYPDLPAERGAALCVPIQHTGSGSPVGAFVVYAVPGEPRSFAMADWDRKVLDILGQSAALARQLADQQEALRAAQDQHALTETFAAIGDVAANLLHRLNNKVGTIPVRVEGIQDKCAAALEADAYLARNLDEIQKSAAEAMQVVRESLFHLHPIQLAPVSVAGSVREALAATRLPEGVQVLSDGLESLPPVQAGQQRLALVFTNLFENAADAMAGGVGTITVSGAAAGGWAAVTVRDDGPGIPPELHERIFTFYTSRAAAQPGRLGFGLWWVKTLITRFGGSITVESDGAHGTAFKIRLPLARENGAADGGQGGFQP